MRLAHLETDICSACQLSCISCNHMVPMYRAHGQQRANPAQVERDLNHLATIMHADRWGALGGEPLLHTGLVDILHVVRRSGVADRIEVWTNGILLSKMKDEFWGAFDVLVLSVYDGKHDDASLAWIAARAADAGVELVVKDERVWHNFRTLLEPSPTDAAATKTKFDGCFFRQFSRVANAGYFYTCCCAPHMPVLIQGREAGADGVCIEGLTEDGLRAYLERSEPLGCCSICAGRDTAQPIQWREERQPKAWLAASAGLTEVQA